MKKILDFNTSLEFAQSFASSADQVENDENTQLNVKTALN